MSGLSYGRVLKNILSAPKTSKDFYFINEKSVNYISLTGSHAYGGATEDSDFDFCGFIIPPVEIIFPHTRGYLNGFESLKFFEQWEAQSIETDIGIVDVAIYGILKYFYLTSKCNPNMIHSLFTPDDCIIHMDVVGSMVRQNRHLFLSELAFHTFRGMSYAHLNKLKNRKRNPTGKRSGIIESYGYDTKDASYSMRLIWELEEVLFKGDLHVDRFGNEILDIRNGKYGLEEIIEMFELSCSKIKERMANNESVVPKAPNWKKIKRLLVSCLEEKYGSLKNFGYDILK